jgi:hypothetical protein
MWGSGVGGGLKTNELKPLDGILMIDRTERDQRKGALKALREGGTYAPESDEDEEEDGEASTEV